MKPAKRTLDNWDKAIRERIRERERQEKQWQKAKERPEWSDTGK